MKKKFSKILGVMLPVAMILALTVTLLPARTPPTVEAAALKFTTVTIPQLGGPGMTVTTGKYVITPGLNIGAIAASGTVMFASVNITDPVPDRNNTLLKSTDSGATWALQGNFWTTANTTAGTLDAGAPTPIVDIGISPSYATDTTLLVATQKVVYQSVDGGTTFSAMTGIWAAAENITDIDVSLDSRGRVAAIVGTVAPARAGRVYVYSPTTTGMSWVNQSVGATWATPRDVLAVAFSPYFSSDEGIFAVTVNMTTEIRNAFGATKNGGAWATTFGDGRFRDRNAADIVANRARIAFPDDFNIDSLTSNIAFVGISAGVADGQNDAGTERGDAYKVIFQPTLSSTIDLDVRGLVSSIQTTTNIWSIDASGDAAAANIVVGTNFWSTGAVNYYWSLYYSTNSGVTWSTPRESQPTGGNPNAANTQGTFPMVNVLLSGDFAKTKTAYAATYGENTSGLSRTTDSAKSWRQISLVDWSSTTNYTLAETDIVSASEWYNRFELGWRPAVSRYSSYWHTKNGGASYERIYSYANPGMPLTLHGLDIRGDVFFLNNRAQGRLWRSTDRGASFPRIVTAKAAWVLGGLRVIDANSLTTLHAGGAVWTTTNLGRLWVEPEESNITGNPTGLSVSGKIWLVRADGGRIFISTDNGTTFKDTLGTRDLPATVSTTFDTGYATNKLLYGTMANLGIGGGLWRIKVDEKSPKATEWERIDNINNTAGAALLTPGPVILVGGIMYLFDSTNATTGDVAGGIWRSTNPTADITGVFPPYFVRENDGVPAGATIGFSARTGTTFFVRITNFVGAEYDRQFLTFTDTIGAAVTSVAPKDKAIDAGVSLSVDDLTMNVVISWKAVAGATSYQWEIARDTKFESVAPGFSGYTTGQEATVPRHITGTTYYWRVRVAQGATAGNVPPFGTLAATAGDPIGAPLISPWSATRSYVTGAAVSAAFKAVSPEVGATALSIQPTFSWTPFVGAIGYEIMVSEDKDFAIIEFSHNVDRTFYKAEEKLRYNTTYYWKVRGVTGAVPKKGPAPGGEWASGVFTTEAEPVAPTPPVIVVEKPAPPAEVKVIEVPVPGPAQPIPSYLLWAIVGIGAILVIALIVLIVRTRRVT